MERLEGVIRTKTAEGKMQLWVIGAHAVRARHRPRRHSWPGYFDPLTKSLTGYIVIGDRLRGCWVVALVLARKVLAVDI